ncbi:MULTISPECIES: AAA family ATPase [Streptococcus]|uniref:AAA family ATPase n=1 Tax=Streptococcus TaxID=1301 RepID=UPI00085C28E2|nr:AAA family ATPase [Streptococcus agalactiae]MBY5056786.1 AAA family ATPase [Streptococcus agalactiae]
MEYILISGVHGVGKTFLLNELKNSSTKHIQVISISKLIKEFGNDIEQRNKLVFDITTNQRIWKDKLKNMKFSEEKTVILDGHLCLLDREGVITELPFSTFEGILIKKLVLKIEQPVIIQQRLFLRDNIDWDITLLTNFQDTERKRAELLASRLQIPLFIYDDDAQIQHLIEFILD